MFNGNRVFKKGSSTDKTIMRGGEKRYWFQKTHHCLAYKTEKEGTREKRGKPESQESKTQERSENTNSDPIM